MSERERHSDPARVGALAARVLEDIYTVVHGRAPVGVRSWCDDDTLLIVMRLAEDTSPGTRLYSAFAPLLAAAVRVRTGWELDAGAVSVEREMGMVIFVFHLPAAVSEPGGGSDAVDFVATAGSGRMQPPRWQPETVHVPSWRAWTPVPSRGVPDAERRRVQTLED